MAWDCDIRWLLVEVDSLCVVQLINNYSEMTNEYLLLVRSIKKFMQRSWHIKVNHIYREANFTTNYLVNYAYDLRLGRHNFNSPPNGVNQFFIHDMYGTVYKRLVLS